MSRGPRRQGREAALKLLYTLDLTGTDWPTDNAVDWEEQPEEAGSEEVRGFAETLFHAVIEHRDELDAVIGRAADNWEVERISRVDMNLMRMATLELLHMTDVPARVVVNEAVDIARRFSDSRSAVFVNGVLDRIARESGRLEKE